MQIGRKGFIGIQRNEKAVCKKGDGIMKDEKTVLKERCKYIGGIFLFFSWMLAAFIALEIAAGIWLGYQPESDFALTLSDTPSGLFGVAEFKGMTPEIFEVIKPYRFEFDPGTLNETASQMPKYVFMAKHFTAAVGVIGGLALVFWFMGRVFRNIMRYETPFIKENSRSIAGLGIAISASIIIGRNMFSFLLFIKGIIVEKFEWIEFLWVMPLILFFCLSAVFDYGRVLQQESDETL